MQAQATSAILFRLRAGAISLAFSLIMAAIAAALVFLLWYPNPYRTISGGKELFILLTLVDVTLGPLLVMVVANPTKPNRERTRDLMMVVTIQLLALAYGLWTVWAARPVHLVYESDRFSVVHAVDVPREMLDKTPAGIQALPWTGPGLLALRPFRDNKEQTDATIQALQGLPLSARPDLWQPYDAARERVKNLAKPLGDLRRRFPEQAQQIDAAVRATGKTDDDLRYLPLLSRKLAWTVLIDAGTANISGFMPLDSF